MTDCSVTLQPSGKTVRVPRGSLVLEAAQEADLDIGMPCGGQGRCGRCVVVVNDGNVRRRSTLRLSAQDLEAGHALACQTVLEGNAVVTVLPQEEVTRHLTTDRTAVDDQAPVDYSYPLDRTVRSLYVELTPPDLTDQMDDWSRLQRALRKEYELGQIVTDLGTLRSLGHTLRAADWKMTAIVETDSWNQTEGAARLVEVLPGDQTASVYGAAIDIGTTTNVVYLVDLVTGRLLARTAGYNGQVTRGEDVISRIIYAGKNGGLAELQELVIQKLNKLLINAASRAGVSLQQVYKVTVAGNTTMMHLFLGLPPQSIRVSPFVPAANSSPPILASELGLDVHPRAGLDCLDGVASYVGSDISAGVVSSGLLDTEELTLFLDIGTNGETVLGTQDWMLTCACSAGPAFEGAGVRDGMRATTGAIEEIWINSETYEPTYRVIGGGKPAGICGSGLISLLAELFITGVIDRAGNPKATPKTPRVREGAHGMEYVVAWAGETQHGSDIVLTKVDVDNLVRTKAAIYAGYTVLCQSAGIDPGDVQQVFIGGAFGQYINIEKAIQIGLLPDLPWERFQFMGNTSVKGAYMALLSRNARVRVQEAAKMMTYVELSADNSFYNSFTSASFLPHTEIARFPSVQAIYKNGDRPESQRILEKASVTA